jgi:signal transduction histidine kinase
MTPIEERHCATRPGRIDFRQLNETLGRRTVELAATNLQLQRGMIRRRSAETAHKQNGEDYPRLLQESLHLQQDLRHLTHQNLTAQEKERHTISHKLQDEIAQTLLAINVRLLTLKMAAKGSTRKLTREIASTQRLVEESVRSINRFALELKLHQQT